jgi:hypothetical protein
MSSPVFYLQSWKGFAEKHNGSITNSHSEHRVHHIAVKDPLRIIQLSIPFKNSHIVFDSGESSSSEISYKFDKDLEIEFSIHQEDYMDRIQKFFGKQDVIIGGSQFDELFFIQTNNESFIREIIDIEAQNFLTEFYQSIANFNLKKRNNKSVLQLKIHFDERNMDTMEKVLELFKHIVSKTMIISPILGS